MVETDWLKALAGGALIGAASALILWAHGQLLGISGLVRALLARWDHDDKWRAAFITGLVLGGALWRAAGLEVFRFEISRSLYAVAAAGLLVGFGTSLGNGCTSGHGICGVSRLSPRSLTATGVFIIAGALSVAVVRTLFGGSL